MEKLCSILECEQKAVARGWCNKHWKRWRLNGDPLVTRSRWDNHEPKLNTCVVPGCDRQQAQSKMCGMHRQRKHRYGDPAIVKPHRRQYHFNEKLLDQWTPESAYFLGWTLTDGGIREYSGKGTSSAVIFDLKDREAIEILSRVLGHTREPQPIGKHWRLSASSVHLVERLKELGVGPAKSLTVTLPPVPEVVFPHFARGVVEGDGSLSIDKKGQFRVSVNSASYEFLKAFQTSVPFDGSFFEVGKGKRKNPLYRLAFAGRKALRFGEWIYRDSNGMRLMRKYERYLIARESKGDAI